MADEVGADGGARRREVEGREPGGEVRRSRVVVAGEEDGAGHGAGGFGGGAYGEGGEVAGVVLGVGEVDHGFVFFDEEELEERKYMEMWNWHSEGNA